MMMRLPRLCLLPGRLCLSALVAVWLVAGGPLAAGRAAEGEGEPIALFNGKDLTGWVNVNGAPGTWSVRDGVIACTGMPYGILRTEAMYENYILELEWRHAQPKGNAGLFVHSDALPAVGRPFSRSIEVQIMDGDHGSVFAIQGATLKPLTNPRGPIRAQPTEPRCYPAESGRWNRYTLTSRDGALDLEVNGKVVTQVEECSLVKGYICLEAEGSDVFFRNIRLTPLPSSQPSADRVAQADEGFTALFDGLSFAGWKLAEGSEGHWVATNGVLSYDGKSEAEGQQRNLWSEASYKDFVLIVDWRLPRQPERVAHPVFSPEGDRIPGQTREILDAGDSGIYLRGSSKSQVNMWCWPIGSGEVYGYRTDPKMPAEVRRAVTPKVVADTPLGQWNRFHITMKGDRLTVVLNGKTVIENAQLPGVASRGPIALQHHGDPIQFANIYIRELD
jgi:hypothetical protein